MAYHVVLHDVDAHLKMPPHELVGKRVDDYMKTKQHRTQTKLNQPQTNPHTQVVWKKIMLFTHKLVFIMKAKQNHPQTKPNQPQTNPRFGLPF